ncbi:ATP-dependent DNA helicase II, 70 kDa subunit, putative [Eimeria maxima]|uniref:ATP-dependent DNA helicase II, 70 kDa subunit, putative n=1 Tax=Eimeria maxima TaxID=5804 RepID=U6MA69_EIMMA|nr:ATP-dependent DNA helicase II, 70 kDa subunit, putative [Eimeria maxima]CDJ61092.1 ATP-dependent DNA helicase II, 70 kDa subunit, putative [Eimeria maxima]
MKETQKMNFLVIYSHKKKELMLAGVSFVRSHLCAGNSFLFGVRGTKVNEGLLMVDIEFVDSCSTAAQEEAEAAAAAAAAASEDILIYRGTFDMSIFWREALGNKEGEDACHLLLPNLQPTIERTFRRARLLSSFPFYLSPFLSIPICLYTSITNPKLLSPSLIHLPSRAPLLSCTRLSIHPPGGAPQSVHPSQPLATKVPMGDTQGGTQGGPQKASQGAPLKVSQGGPQGGPQEDYLVVGGPEEESIIVGGPDGGGSLGGPPEERMIVGGPQEEHAVVGGPPGVPPKEDGGVGGPHISKGAPQGGPNVSKGGPQGGPLDDIKGMGTVVKVFEHADRVIEVTEEEIRQLKAAIVTYVLKRGAPVQLGALLPQM